MSPGTRGAAPPSNTPVADPMATDPAAKSEQQQQHSAQPTKACEVCGKHPVSLRCGKCKRVYYCSKEHQRSSWKTHKLVCAPSTDPEPNKPTHGPAGSSSVSVDEQTASPQPKTLAQQLSDSLGDESSMPMPVPRPLPSADSQGKLPIAVIVIGMAGSGKTTLMQRINAHVHQHKTPSYFINLDPAVSQVPYGANIDIRDTVNYKEVMKQYNLGPNGGIMTALNLFSTRFDQVMNFVEKKQDSLKYVFLDTPGQIEVFTWSASGTIVTEALAGAFPTVVLYVIDTPRTASPVTFMSNMMHACSIMYKAKLPFILVFNKTDVASHEFALNWMEDFDAFADALQSDKTYMSTFTRSMALVLDEFYNTLSCVGVSALTGAGMDSLFEAIQKGGAEYFEEYLPSLQKRIDQRKQRQAEEQKAKVDSIVSDMAKSQGKKIAEDFHSATAAPASKTWSRPQADVESGDGIAASVASAEAETRDYSHLLVDHEDPEEAAAEQEEYERWLAGIKDKGK